MRKIGDVEVKGIDVDSQTRCEHYHSERDIIAIKFKCCGEWFSCFECHTAVSGEHTPQVWPISERSIKAILCGACRHHLSIAEYFASDSICPKCGSQFNPNCALHYDLYFEV